MGVLRQIGLQVQAVHPGAQFSAIDGIPQKILFSYHGFWMGAGLGWRSTKIMLMERARWKKEKTLLAEIAKIAKVKRQEC